LKETSTFATGIGHVGGEGEEPVPEMAISAQLKYTCGV
jgi:hypothetical protein